jgi:hypothetical protein
MPIVNIVDRRKRRYRFLRVNAIVEAAWHDNRCDDADQVASREGPVYEQVEHIPLRGAIAFAEAQNGEVTLFLYDEDDGIYAVDMEKIDVS